MKCFSDLTLVEVNLPLLATDATCDQVILSWWHKLAIFQMCIFLTHLTTCKLMGGDRSYVNNCWFILFIYLYRWLLCSFVPEIRCVFFYSNIHIHSPPFSRFLFINCFCYRATRKCCCCSCMYILSYLGCHLGFPSSEMQLHVDGSVPSDVVCTQWCGLYCTAKVWRAILPQASVFLGCN